MNSITFFMKAFLLSVLLSVSFFSFGQKHTSSIGFIENKGQIVDQKGKENKDVKYLLNANGLNVQLRQNGFSYDVYEVEKIPLTKTDKEFYSIGVKEKNNEPNFSTKIKFHRIDIDFLNSNKNSQLFAEEKSDDYDNYYNVLHAPEGITNVHKYQKVTYKNIYDNVDVVFFIPKDSTKVVEYNFIVKPGGKISDIQLKFNGAKTDLIDNKIQMNLRFGQMEETIPMSWTEQENNKREIKINYKKIKKNVYCFDGNLNSSDKTIVIDPVPVRLWGTYYGRGSGFQLLGIENDNLSNVFLSGSTDDSSNIATSGSFMPNKDLFYDAFVVKFDLNGNRIWGTYYGGNNNDSFNSVSFYNNEIILSGTTRSSNNISTVGSFKENLTPGGFSVSDVFLTKLDSNGFRLWGTYYGGEHDDRCYKSIVDTYGNIILVGGTYSINGIATPGTFKDSKSIPVNYHIINEGFIAKFSNSGFQIWGSYYNLCYIWGLDIDSNSNIFFSGDVSYDINNFTTLGTHQPTFNYDTSTGVHSYESFIIKFNPGGQRIWGTYYGNGWENNHSLKVDHLDDIIISGSTRSSELISTPNSHQPDLNINFQTPSDAYLAKFNQNGQLVWGTYYGGDERENLDRYTIDIDENNNIFLTGNTSSTNNISTPNTYNFIPNGGYDSFIIKFHPNGQRIWGTYFGGNSGDFTTTIKYDKEGIFYLTGNTYSTNNIASNNSHQQYNNSSRSFFLEKFLDCQSVTIASSNSPTCIGSNLELTASGGTSYNWSGPNGFTSTNQNPIIPNASVANSGQYTCEITGTGGCDNTISLNVVVGDSIAPVPNIASLPQISGDCNTIVSTIPTALDNCAGAINATTTDPLAYSIPGNYTITWNFDDGNGNSSTQTQNVEISSVIVPTVTSPQTFCLQDNATINEIVITGQNITWYDTQTGGNILPITTALQNGITYYATQTINSCESDRAPIIVTIQNTPVPTGSATQTFCSTQNASLNDISINGTNIIWYADNTSTTALSNSTVLLDNTSYFATQIVNGCESPTRFEVLINLINTLNALDYQETICDDLDDGFEIINLTSSNSNLITTTGNTFSYYTSLNGAENQISSAQINNVSNYNLHIGTTTIFVRIDSQNGCHQVVALKLTLVSKPRIAISDIMPICEGTSITINAGNGFDSYDWSTGATTQSVIVSQAGNYSVTVTENHNGISCSSTKNFTVVNSNAATVSEIITSDWTDNNNTITVLISNSSVGNYVYSLDGINYQNSNVFYGLESGEHTVFVKDTNGCGISREEIYLLMYPKYFTPNGDSYNDTWKIKFSQKEPNLKVAIFDRYGKLLKMMNSYDAWDGKLNGKDLPSDDYWFVVTRQNGKEFRGHFAMKR